MIYYSKEFVKAKYDHLRSIFSYNIIYYIEMIYYLVKLL